MAQSVNADSGGALNGLGARVHLFVQPTARAAFTGLFRDVLGCRVAERDFGLAHPILLVTFGDGSSFSVEFTELGPRALTADTITDDQAFRGAWLEFRAPDVERVHAALRAAGVPEFRHPGSSHAYFSAPGGQVFRVIALDYQGP
jgi:catechol 2,3-dioxygenase-like lactoylglutathione lyase family enzyme